MIHIVLGTRAQLIKMAPIMVELQKQKIKYNFIFLAQHNETMQSMLDMFGIKKPDYVLGNINKDIVNAKTMFFWSINVLVSALKNRKKIFKNDKNGIVLVHGDAPPAFLGAIIAKLSGLKVGHVESGLRSFKLFKPFPEEIIRLLTFRLTNYYFCSGQTPLQNVSKYSGIKINTIQNTLLDSLRLANKHQSQIHVAIPKKKYAIFTTHRFETISEKAKLEAVIEIANKISRNIKVLFILHPPTKSKLIQYNLMKKLESNKNIELRPRYDYFEFIKLITHAEFIATDGGSNQEECYYLGKPCLILRNETERNEGIGKNAIISHFDNSIISNFVKNYKQYQIKKVCPAIYPSKKIIEEIKKYK